MKKQFTLIFALLITSYIVSGQITDSKKEPDLQFSVDSIKGVYIPTDLENCFKQINSLWNDSIKAEVRNWSEEEFVSNAHFGFGMWIRNNWQLWGGSRLSKYFNDMGVYHPDDMSSIILCSYHRYLANQEIMLEEQIKHYKDFWEKSNEKNLEGLGIEFVNYKIGDTVLYSYNHGFINSKQERDYDKGDCIAKGIIIEKNEDYFLIYIRLIESCGRKGIVYYDNKNTNVYNEKTKKWEKPLKREIKYMVEGMEIWFSYFDWETD